MQEFFVRFIKTEYDKQNKNAVPKVDSELERFRLITLKMFAVQKELAEKCKVATIAGDVFDLTEYIVHSIAEMGKKTTQEIYSDLHGNFETLVQFTRDFLTKEYNFLIPIKKKGLVISSERLENIIYSRKSCIGEKFLPEIRELKYVLGCESKKLNNLLCELDIFTGSSDDEIDKILAGETK